MAKKKVNGIPYNVKQFYNVKIKENHSQLNRVLTLWPHTLFPRRLSIQMKAKGCSVSWLAVNIQKKE